MGWGFIEKYTQILGVKSGFTFAGYAIDNPTLNASIKIGSADIAKTAQIMSTIDIV